MVQKTLEICLSETHASGNREAQTKDLSSEVMLIPDEKATMEKGMKGGHREGTQKQKVWKVHFCFDGLHHLQKYEYNPENVRESHLKCGNYENLNRDNH